MWCVGCVVRRLCLPTTQPTQTTFTSGTEKSREEKARIVTKRQTKEIYIDGRQRFYGLVHRSFRLRKKHPFGGADPALSRTRSQCRNSGWRRRTDTSEQGFG